MVGQVNASILSKRYAAALLWTISLSFCSTRNIASVKSQDKDENIKHFIFIYEGHIFVAGIFTKLFISLCSGYIFIKFLYVEFNNL